MRIWKIGFGKTGTTSLHQALGRMGLRSCHKNRDCDCAAMLVINVKEGLPVKQLSLLHDYDAFTDGEYAGRNYKHLYHADPEAKFILTTRNVEHWIDSKLVSILHHRMNNPQRSHHAGYNINTNELREEFIAHQEEVQEFFADKPGSLLVFNCCDGNDGYKELAAFLQRPQPSERWPRANLSTHKINDIKVRLRKRSGK